jgi:hypothetical protein
VRKKEKKRERWKEREVVFFCLLEKSKSWYVLAKNCSQNKYSLDKKTLSGWMYKNG